MEGLMGYYFDHERLKVYQEAIAFVAWWEEISHRCTRVPSVKDQLDRASTSTPLNIAEGNGKLSGKDRCRYLLIASGSTLECAACLDVLVARKVLSAQAIEPGKKRLQGIVSMLIGLINSVSARVAEESPSYGSGLQEEDAPQPSR
jgi:four helix bundle protein